VTLVVGVTSLVARAASAQTATPHVEATYPHDTTAFTEGLELFEGKLYESTGLSGKSTLRRVTLTTGAIEKNQALDSMFFGEGLTRIDRTLIQLTYTTGVAIVYDLDTFAELSRLTYTGQGWGLCYDGTDLVMSNGSDKLAFRDPVTFAVRREVTVRSNGTSIDNLNELECVGSLVYINEWKTDNILRVDKATGNVITLIDASALLTADEKKSADVLNGIAYDAAKRRFYLTGKYWPKVFEVSFDFEPGGDADAGVVDAGAQRDAGADASAPGDATVPRDVAIDRTVDAANPRDAGVLRDSAARDAPRADGNSNDGSPPPNDANPTTGGGGGGGAAGAGGGGTSGSGASAGAAPADESGNCACHLSRSAARAPWHFAIALLGAALVRVVQRPSRRAGRRVSHE
jgi:glutaminyl-peptide cyclotransferase